MLFLLLFKGRAKSFFFPPGTECLEIPPSGEGTTALTLNIGENLMLKVWRLYPVRALRGLCLSSLANSACGSDTERVCARAQPSAARGSLRRIQPEGRPPLGSAARSGVLGCGVKPDFCWRGSRYEVVLIFMLKILHLAIYSKNFK